MAGSRSYVVGFTSAAVVAARVIEIFATTAAERVIVARDAAGRIFADGHVEGSYASRLPCRIGVYTRDVPLGQIVEDVTA